MTRTPADRFHAFGAPAVVAVLQVVVALATVGAVALAPPTFMSAVNYRTGGLDVIFPDSGGPVWMVAADVNGDGELDLLVANWCASSRQCTEGNVGVLLNRGDATFHSVVTYRSGGLHAFSVSAADMNGDGIPDLVVANGCGGLWSLPLPACPDGSLGMLLGNGDGTFQAVQSFPSGGSLTAMVIADVNNDGRLDVVGSNCAPSGQLCPFGNGTVGVLLGNGDGSVQPVQIYESGGLAATFVAVADVDGDHHLDVLVSNQRICDNCRGNVGVLRGRGNGTFESAQTYATDIFAPAFLVAADLNGDQTPDLVLTENVGGGGQLAVLLNRGDGAFHAAVVYSTGGLYATPLVLSDVNGDGKPDLLVSNAQFCEGHPLSDGCVGILLGTGDGTFQPAVTYSSGAIGAWSLAVADFDGDGALDVAVANQCNTSSCAGVATLGVLAGHGDGTFGQAVIYPTDRNSVLVVAADLNGDGNPDLAVGNATTPSGSISVLLNTSVPVDMTPPSITLSVTPGRLWPPNGKLVPITISGAITDTGSGVNASSATYSVSDEYGEVEPVGGVPLGSGGQYSFTVWVEASRRGSDRDGRRYTVAVRANDEAGNAGSAPGAVIVPHDRRK